MNDNNSTTIRATIIELESSADMEARDSLYLTDDANETTFKYDDKLPSLPVPKLEQTVHKLLDTIEPIGYGNKFELTKKRAQEFLEDANVLELQQMLEERAKTSRNWLEDWWLEFAYLRSRKPLIPFSNMAAPLPIQPFWPVLNKNCEQYETCRAQRSALSIYFILSFWLMLRQEKMRPMIHKGVPWSMSQFRYLFNTCRLPYDTKDVIKSHFRVSSEGRPESVEMIILHKGYIFALNPTQQLNNSGKITSQNNENSEPKLLTPPALEKQLRYIEDWAKYRPYGPGVGALTTTDRDDWAEAYNYLSGLSDTNKQILERIEKALAVFVLDDDEPENSNQIARYSMCGNPLNRWADKSLSSIAFKNGTFGANADHTPYDGFCTGIMTHYLLTSIKECNGKWTDDMQKQQASGGGGDDHKPELLSFKLDDKLNSMILKAKTSFEETCSTIDMMHCIFDHYGKDLVKQHRFHPEAFVQCAIHLTYYRLHKKAAPAYVTASTRRFYRGRTETCRSCYPEMIEFAQSMLNDNIDVSRHISQIVLSLTSLNFLS